jgi:HK97 family phage major capsid protein
MASAAPFTGAMNAPGIHSHSIKGGNPYSLGYKDFREAILKVPAEERKDCCWFFNETILSHATNLSDSEGRPIWRGPQQEKPGTIDGYRYHECSLLPQINEVRKNEPFAIFMNPKRIKHGNRRGI